MTWCERHRLDWIAESLRVYGFINREHLQRKFGISQPQASKDLQTFQRLNPSAMVYDMSQKCYQANGDARKRLTAAQSADDR